MLAHAHRIAHASEGGIRIGEARIGGNSRETIDRLIANAEVRTGHPLTTEHRNAVAGMLAGSGGLYLLQGRAGSGETTGVLELVARHATDHGWRVRAMAPTASAAATLGGAVMAESSTVASVIARPQRRDSRQELWIIDEAGLASAKDMAAVLAQADRAGACVILTGDTKQIGSVGAGSAFQQLQDTLPDATFSLTEIKRQRSAELRQAVVDSVHGRLTEALERVSVAEHRDRDGAVTTIADAYVRRSAEEKDTLVVALSRADRADINAAIQKRREAAGSVTNARDITTLAAKGWTAEQRKDASRYHEGDVIVARRDFKYLAHGEAAVVARAGEGKVTVQTARGEWTFDPSRVSAYSVMKAERTRIGEGDHIVLKGATDARVDGERQQLRNGTELTITEMHGDQLTATDARGRVVEIDAGHGVQADLAYAQTADQAQGRTVDSVIGYMRSGQSNLATQQRAYVLLSRARDDALIVTDNKAKLAEALTKNRGDKETALERNLNHVRLEGTNGDRDTPRIDASPSTEWPKNAGPMTQESGVARLRAMATAEWGVEPQPHQSQSSASQPERGADYGLER